MGLARSEGRLEPPRTEETLRPSLEPRPRFNLTLAGLLGIFFGILTLGAGLRSVGRTAVDDAVFYTGGVLLPLGIALLLAGVIEASRRKREDSRRGLDVVDAREQRQQH